MWCRGSAGRRLDGGGQAQHGILASIPSPMAKVARDRQTGDRQNQCDHEACALNMVRWIKLPAVHPQPFACGMKGFSAPMPLWETLKLHYPEVVSRGYDLTDFRFLAPGAARCLQTCPCGMRGHTSALLVALERILKFRIPGGTQVRPGGFSGE